MALNRHRHYRVPTRPLATAWARHLDAVMRERDLSQTNVFGLVADELGLAPTSRTALRDLFSDKTPDERQAAALRRHFGEPPAEPEPPAPAGDALVESVQEQTKTIGELYPRVIDLIAEQQRQMAEQQETNRLLAARLEQLEMLVTTLVTAPPQEAGVDVMRAWGRSALERIRSQVQPLDPAPAGEG